MIGTHEKIQITLPYWVTYYCYFVIVIIITCELPAAQTLNSDVQVLVKFAGIANSPVTFAFREASLRITKGAKWNVCWGRMLDAASFALLHEFQRVNHFPGERGVRLGHLLGELRRLALL